MIQTLALSTIAGAWRDALAADEGIRSWCLEHYGKALRIFVGINHKRPPTEADCPYIVIRPGVKEEGELDEFTYVISVGWAIRNEHVTESDGVIEQDGIAESDELGQLVYGVLVDLSPPSPVTKCVYELEPTEFWPQFVGQMELEISITPTIGGSITY